MANLNEAYNRSFQKKNKFVDINDSNNQDKEYKCNCGGTYSYISKKYKMDETGKYDLIYRCNICRSFRLLQTY